MPKGVLNNRLGQLPCPKVEVEPGIWHLSLGCSKRSAAFSWWGCLGCMVIWCFLTYMVATYTLNFSVFWWVCSCCLWCACQQCLACFLPMQLLAQRAPPCQKVWFDLILFATLAKRELQATLAKRVPQATLAKRVLQATLAKRACCNGEGSKEIERMGAGS